MQQQQYAKRVFLRAKRRASLSSQLSTVSLEDVPLLGERPLTNLTNFESNQKSEPSLAPKDALSSIHGNRSRNWFGTGHMDDFNQEELQRLVDTQQVIKWDAVFERGEKRGYHHFHVVVNTTLPQRLTWLRSNVNAKAMWEPVRDLRRVREYMRKDGDRSLYFSGGKMWPELDSLAIAEGRTMKMSKAAMFETALQMDSVGQALEFLQKQDVIAYMNNMVKWKHTLKEHFTQRRIRENQEEIKACGPQYTMDDFLLPVCTPIITAIKNNPRCEVIWIWSKPRFGKTCFLDTWFNKRIQFVHRYKELEQFDCAMYDAICYDDYEWTKRDIQEAKHLLENWNRHKILDQRYVNGDIKKDTMTFVCSQQEPRKYFVGEPKAEVDAIISRLIIIHLTKPLYNNKK